MKKYNILIVILVLICIAALCVMFLPQYLQDRQLTAEEEEVNELYNELMYNPDEHIQDEQEDVLNEEDYSELMNSVTLAPPETSDEPTPAPVTPSPEEDGAWNPFETAPSEQDGLLNGLTTDNGEKAEGKTNYNTGPRFGKYKYDTTDIDPVANPDAYNAWLTEHLKTPTPTPIPTATPVPTPKVGKTGADLAKCKSVNSDFVAWITIPGSNVNYPIVQSDNIEHYLDYNFYGKKSNLGTLFTLSKSNWKRPGKNIVVFGHDVEGSGNKMFKALLQYKNESYYNTHKTIYLDSIYHTGVYEVFAAFDITVGDLDPSTSNFASNAEFLDLVYAAKDLTNYKTTAVINEEDTIVSLVTCDRFFKRQVGRFVVMAVRISD